MLTFSHPNVMPLIGLCLDQETPLVIMPFMSKGNLLQHVREHKENLYLTESSNTEQVMIQSTSDCMYINFVKYYRSKLLGMKVWGCVTRYQRE